MRILRWTVLVLLVGLLPGAALLQVLPDEPVDALPMLPVSETDRVGRVNVTVRDAEGRLLAGALVRAVVVRRPEGPAGVQHETAFLAARATSGSDGVARLVGLAVGPCWFLAESKGLARATTQRFVGMDPVEIELRLGPARAISVEVRDERGRAIPYAEVEVQGADPVPKGARADASGIALPSGVAMGALRVTARAPGWDEVTVPVDASTKSVRITLHRLGTLTVTVVDGDGRQVEGAKVAIAGGMLAVPRVTSSGPNGVARIVGLPSGSYDLRATKGLLVAPPEIGIALARGADATARLVLVQGATAALVVVDDLGNPVPGAEVVIVEGGLSPFPLLATTDAQGHATIAPVAPGVATVGARAKGFVARGPLPLVRGDAPMTIVLRRAATVVGDVRDARGFPVDGATIEIVGTDLDGLPVSATSATIGFQAALFARGSAGPRTLLPLGELGVVPGPVPPIPRVGSTPTGSAIGVDPWVTRADGSFSASPIPAGRLRAIVRHPSYVEGVSDIVEVPPAGEGRVTVVLSAGGRVHGRVRDERGFTVSGAWLEVSARHGTLSRGTRTASDGTYALAAVPREVSLTLASAERPYEVALRLDVEVPDSGDKELDLVLPSPRGAARVHVVDDRRYPVRGAQVTVASLDPRSPLKVTAFTDERGDAEVLRVAGVKAELSVSAPGHAPHRALVESFPTVLEVELAQGISVKGVVYAPGGRTTLEGAMVSLLGDAGVRRTRSDAQGRFSFVDVPRGEATLDVRAAGTAGARRTLSVGPTGSRAETDAGRVELAASGVVEGTVVDEKGRGVAGARVARDRVPTFVPAGGIVVGVAMTDSTGAFKLPDVAIGEVTIEAYAVDVGRGQAEKVRVDEGRTTTGVKIVLSATAKGAAVELSPGGVAVTLADVDGKISVASVSPGSEAERAGLLEGDELREVDGIATSTIADARARLSGPLADVIVRVRRGGTERSLRVPREPIRR